MLNKQENAVMSVIYDACGGKESCLISPEDILAVLHPKSDFDRNKLDKIINSLELDDYFDLIRSDRKGQEVYCFSLHSKGVAYKRTNLQSRRNIYYRIVITVAFAVLSFVVGLILKAIF